MLCLSGNFTFNFTILLHIIYTDDQTFYCKMSIKAWRYSLFWLFFFLISTIRNFDIPSGTCYFLIRMIFFLAICNTHLPTGSTSKPWLPTRTLNITHKTCTFIVHVIRQSTVDSRELAGRWKNKFIRFYALPVNKWNALRFYAVVTANAISFSMLVVCSWLWS